MTRSVLLQILGDRLASCLHPLPVFSLHPTSSPSPIHKQICHQDHQQSTRDPPHVHQVVTGPFFPQGDAATDEHLLLIEKKLERNANMLNRQGRWSERRENPDDSTRICRERRRTRNAMASAAGAPEGEAKHDQSRLLEMVVEISNPYSSTLRRITSSNNYNIILHTTRGNLRPPRRSSRTVV